ncbi:uncharacterized protein TNCT_326681 [Trichonephila clavata]|uniref:Uncharacterized protein n=1 Tax=Trichonephila clavata TaxID=2740835 RepID=A0A8X6EZJ1_TRICU|nr:uncharacterized protein TNCT_326681 [Trichonephila clavata]
MTPEPRYGFMYLKRASPSDAYVIHCFTDSLYDNMISCVQAATSYSMDTTDSDCKMKIAYFKILNNSAIVRELHNPSVYRQSVPEVPKVLHFFWISLRLLTAFFLISEVLLDKYVPSLLHGKWKNIQIVGSGAHKDFEVPGSRLTNSKN